jgi:ABC-type Zn uptake system ZnuABC Zn-binding protein ZnuA
MLFRKFTIILIGLIWITSSSVTIDNPHPRPANAQDNRLSIVATTTIIADVLQNVAGDTADVSSLMQAGQDPHTYQPTGNDIILLDDADLIFVNGANYEEGLLSVLEEAANSNIIEISTCVEILAFGGHDHDAADEEHEHDEEMTASDSHFAEICEAHHSELEGMMGVEEHDEHHEHTEETLGMLYALDCGEVHEHEDEEHHQEGSCDPHTWGDIHNVMLWTLLARDTLSELDPSNADIYAANATAYLQSLHELNEELEALVETVPVENRLLVTNHDSFSYLAYSYGFEVIGTVIPAATTAAEPSASDVVDLIEVIEDSGVTAIFTENVVGNDVARQLADETGANIYQLYSEALTGTDGDAPTYIDFMRYNLTTIVTALSQ